MQAVVHNNLPFGIGENKYFQQLVLAGAERSKLKLPGRMTVSRKINDIYEREKNVLKTALAGVDCVHITFDLWYVILLFFNCFVIFLSFN